MKTAIELDCRNINSVTNIKNFIYSNSRQQQQQQQNTNNNNNHLCTWNQYRENARKINILIFASYLWNKTMQMNNYFVLKQHKSSLRPINFRISKLIVTSLYGITQWNMCSLSLEYLVFTWQNKWKYAQQHKLKLR